VSEKRRTANSSDQEVEEFMYVNVKMIPVETIPGMEGVGRKKENSGGVKSTMIYFIHYKNFCKSHNVPQPSTTIKKKRVHSLYL
jgi:hypothetical protein